ncbi:MAG: retron system putative HNH endonuclease [Flavobacterium sp.]|jgi:uncharacterized protein (TIGR02646 family)
MKRIIRKDSPAAFEDWKLHENPKVWNALPSSLPAPASRLAGVHYYSKKELREALNAQQGYLCAYCMARVDDTHKTRIEHSQTRNRAPELTFTYTNLLTVCNGEDEKPAGIDKLHCDNSRGNQILLVSPFDGNCETHFRFDAAGQVHHMSNEGEDTIKILNLNIRKLKHLRNEAINDFFEVNQPVTEQDFVLLEQMLQNRTGNEFMPFCVAILSLLNA